MSKPIPFTVKSTGPTVIEITREDGSTWEITLTLAVLGITDAEQVNPVNKLPIFNFQATLITETKGVASKKAGG